LQSLQVYIRAVASKDSENFYLALDRHTKLEKKLKS